MRSVLIVHHDPLLCEVMAAQMQEDDAEATCVATGTLAAVAIMRKHFDLALVNVSLSGLSGIELAKLTVSENIPTLLLSGHPQISAELRKVGYPFLEKPFSMERLLQESKLALRDSFENIRRVKASAARMQSELHALLAEISEARRIWGSISQKL